MNTAVSRDQLATRAVQRDAFTPVEEQVDGSDGAVRSGALSVLLFAAGALLLGQSILGTSLDLHPEFLTAVAIILFALALRSTGGTARTSAPISSDDQRSGHPDSLWNLAIPMDSAGRDGGA